MAGHYIHPPRTVPAPTLERVLQRIAHNVPLLDVAGVGGQDEMLLRGGQAHVSNDARPGDGHGADLWGQRHGQPAGERDE